MKTGILIALLLLAGMLTGCAEQTAVPDDFDLVQYNGKTYSNIEDLKQDMPTEIQQTIDNLVKSGDIKIFNGLVYVKTVV